MKENIIKKSGITLIALVVTIIVLLILASVSITAIAGEHGIIEQAKEAKRKTEESVNVAQQDMSDLLEELDGILSGETPNQSTPTGPDGEQHKDPLKADGSFDEGKSVNTPKLKDGMTPVKWNEEQKRWDETVGSDANWYEYSSYGTESSHWANAIIKGTDGQIESYWVWIPRFAYKITSGYHTGGSSAKGKIDVKFLHDTSNSYTTRGTETAEAKTSVTANGTTSTAVTDYVVHPAFTWNSQPISGIWVAKFEASKPNATATSEGAESGTTIKVLPGVKSWRSIKIDDIFTKCKSYKQDLQSHMMKNTEWGAVAYLAQSQYGINSGNNGDSKEIGVNQCSDYITGAGPGGSAEVSDTNYYAYNSVSSEFETKYGYTGTQGVKASTTGNVYGVYDMSGGSWEYVAAYVNNGNSNINTYGASIKTAAEESESYMVDKYESHSSSGTSTASTDYETAKNKYGDAVYETSSSASGTNSWYGDCSYFPSSSYPFFLRGGYYGNGSDAGLFYFSDYDGDALSNYSFRPVLLAL